MTRNLCDGCRMAEVRAHRGAKRRAAGHERQVVQESYSESLATLPPGEVRGSFRIAEASTAGVSQGLRSPSRLGCEMLGANAAHISATIVFVPVTQSAANVFFSANRRHFYNHVRNICRALNIGRRPIGSPVNAPLRTRATKKGPTRYARQTINRALAKALRWARIYMQAEMIPLALKMGCSKTQIWHLETGNNVVMAKWVKAYAVALGLSEAGLWAYADALEVSIDEPNDPSLMVRQFVQLVLLAPEA